MIGPVNAQYCRCHSIHTTVTLYTYRGKQFTPTRVLPFTFYPCPLPVTLTCTLYPNPLPSPLVIPFTLYRIHFTLYPNPHPEIG